MKPHLRKTIAVLLALQPALSVAGGDPIRGKPMFNTCAACHGQKAEGMSALNAPALTGLEPWYIVRQLKNFKDGIRGGNPKDVYGLQMAPMAQTLPDEQAMEDVAAYIKTLHDQ